MWILPIPRDGQFRRTRVCRGSRRSGSNIARKLPGLDIVRNVLDRRNLWHTVEDVPFQPERRQSKTGCRRLPSHGISESEHYGTDPRRCREAPMAGHVDAVDPEIGGSRR